MKRCLTVLVLLWGYGFFQEAIAQPGFLGRRNIVHYDVFAMPTRLTHSKSYNGFYIHTSHQLGYDRIISRRAVWGLSGTYVQLPKRWARYPSYTDPQDGSVIPKALGVAVHFKTYPFLHGGWLAPVGPYFRLSVNLNLENSTWYAEDPPFSERFWESHVYAAYGFELGYSEVVASRILMDLGLRLCFADAVNAGSHSVFRTARLAQEIYNSELFRLHLGMGYLFGK